MSNSQPGKYRRGTRFKVSFPTLPSFKAVPRTVDLIQEPYKHDVMVLTYPKFSAAWFKNLKTGTPIVLDWVQGTVSKRWTGYVSHVSKHAISQRETPMEITCIGASFVLKQKSKQVFKNQTIPEVAAYIAKKYKLNFVGDSHPRRFGQIAMAGKSYWQWLQESAKKIGFVVYVDGVNLVFKSFDKVINSQSKSVAHFALTGTALPMNSVYLDRTLDSLKIVNGDFVEGLDVTRAKQTTAGVDPVTGKILNATHDPKTIGANLRVKAKASIFDEYNVTQVVNDFVSVETAAKGAAQRARFTIPAKAVGQGDPRVHPYSPIQISGTGDDTDGLWIVLKAHHMLHRVGDYQIEMALATDGTGPNATYTFRNAALIDSNTVNIDELLLQTNATNVGTIVPILASTGYNLVEGSQSFGDNPAYWGYRRYSDQGCCGQ
jgi:phage protein D